MKKQQKGYIILEAMLSIVVLSMVVLSVIPMLSFLLRRTSVSAYEAQASLLLQEGMEVTYNIFTSKWDSAPTSGLYHPGKSGVSKWALFTGEEANLETRFTRVIEIKKECSNSDGQVVDSTGAICRQITTKVTWQEAGETRELVSTLNVVQLNTNAN